MFVALEPSPQSMATPCVHSRHMCSGDVCIEMLNKSCAEHSLVGLNYETGWQ